MRFLGYPFIGGKDIGKSLILFAVFATRAFTHYFNILRWEVWDTLVIISRPKYNVVLASGCRQPRILI